MGSDRKPSIKPTPDGPYLVKNLENFSNRKGAIEARGTMALCRCGRSSSKPYCDGTHNEIGFSSAKQDDRVPDSRDDYAGAAVTIHDNRGICAHAGRCTDGLPAVFRLKQEPWIDPDAATPEEIIETLRQCPSGALGYLLAGGGEGDAGGAGEPAIFIAPNGPYVVSGGPELLDTERGQGASPQKFTLCRCGGSKNKPFCDGTHWYNKFTDDEN